MNYDIRVVINADGLDGTTVNVTSRAKAPWKQFSPFYMWKEGIPVPGMQNATAKSVESIWQGLKLIDERTAVRMFAGKPYKRPTPGEKRAGLAVVGHKYGDELLGIVEARQRIFVPAYRYVLEKRIPQELTDQLVSLTYDCPLNLRDVTDNADIRNTSRPYAHAAVLKDFIAEKRANLDATVKAEFDKLYVPDGDLWEYADAAKEYREGLAELKKKALDHLVLGRLGSADRRQRETAIAVCGSAGMHRAEQGLIGLLDSDCRDLAMDALGMLKCSEAYGRIEMYVNTDSAVSAVFSLALIDPVRSLPHIKKAISGEYCVWDRLSPAQAAEKLAVLLSDLPDCLKGKDGIAFINDLRDADNKNCLLDEPLTEVRGFVGESRQFLNAKGGLKPGVLNPRLRHKKIVDAALEKLPFWSQLNE